MTALVAAGVDVGRDYLDVAFAPQGRGFRAPNTAGGVETILARLRRAGARKVVMESIGSFGARLVRALAEAGFEVGVSIRAGSRRCGWPRAAGPRPTDWTRR